MRCVGGRARTYGRHHSRCSASLAGHVQSFPLRVPQQHTRPSAHGLATTAAVVRSARNPRACCSAHTARDEMLGKRGTHENAVVVLGRARLLAHSASCKEGGGEHGRIAVRSPSAPPGRCRARPRLSTTTQSYQPPPTRASSIGAARCWLGTTPHECPSERYTTAPGAVQRRP